MKPKIADDSDKDYCNNCETLMTVIIQLNGKGQKRQKTEISEKTKQAWSVSILTGKVTSFAIKCRHYSGC